MSPLNSASLLPQFRQSLVECRDLYLESSRFLIDHHGNLLSESPPEFIGTMNDLHKGLLIKIYATMAEADMRWASDERKLARVLFRHVWKQELTGDKLRRAAKKVFQDANDLTWYSLVRPFDRLPPLRDRVGQLETVITRVANLIAKVDGDVSDAEESALRAIQDEMDRIFHRLPLNGTGTHQQTERLGAQAVEVMKAESDELRNRYDLPDGNGPEAAEIRKASLEDALKDLDDLIGLTDVKSEVRTLTNFLAIQKKRKEHGLPETDLSLHLVFKGNPGTGKTTVARIVGQIYGALGVLEKGHVVETDRSGLVAEFAGQTGPKTHQKIDEALDGVLFIDEAYSLIAQAADDAYGHEAVQALLKRMEDDRHRLVVILAGYPEPMDQLLSSNPGLSSRFNTRLYFKDYLPTELGRIFQVMCDANHYEVPAASQIKLLVGLRWLYERRDEHFGNGRLVRNVFEKAIRQLANRIASVAPLTKELLTLLEPADLDLGVPDEAFVRCDDEDLKVKLSCPECEHAGDVSASYLGRHVKCAKCSHGFEAAWGDPVL